MPIVRVGLDEDIDHVMDRFSIGSHVRIKCRVAFTLRDHTLSLSCERIDLMSTVKVVID
jgi:hypothetical protein